MRIRYDHVLQLMSEYSGFCKDDERNKLFTYRVLTRALHRGPRGVEKLICMIAQNGCITLPKDVATVIRANINGHADRVWSSWYEFIESASYQEFSECRTGVQEIAGDFFTVYDGPTNCGFYVAAKPRNYKKDKDGYVIVHGVDEQGKEIYIPHYHKDTKEQINYKGEYLPFGCEKAIRNTVKIKKITGIEKSKTTDYVDLYWVVPEKRLMGWMGCYGPDETNPCYKRYRINGCDGELNKVTLLTKIKILSEYHFNEFVPIPNIDIVEGTAQEMELRKSNRHDEANAVRADNLAITKQENSYYWNGDDPIDFIEVTSPGSDTNLQ